MTAIESAGLGAVVALLVVLPFLVAARRAAARERAERLERERIAEGRAAEVRHLAQVVLPAVAERARDGQWQAAGIPPALGTGGLGEDFAAAVERLHTALGRNEGARYERALRDSVQSAYESVARTMHAMATVQQGVLDDIGRDIQDPALMGKVMRADHAAAQMIHKAQTLLVMSGIWPARRETSPVSLYDCVRGAQSRIIEFNRVEVHGGENLYVVAPAVEGVMHVLAELCQNATTFSPPSTSVIVTFREVGAGVVVQIDDASLGMAPDVLERAVTSLREELEVAQLGAMPRLGLACVGRWARELGLSVDLSGASAYGGIRATVFLPHQLLTESVRTPPAGMTAGPAAAVTLPAPHTGSGPAAAGSGLAADGAGPAGAGPELSRGGPRPAAAGPPVGGTEGRPGLPQRRARRGRTAGAPAAPGATPPPAPVPSSPSPPPSPQAHPASPADAWSPQDAGASVAGVVAGTRRGRAQSAQATLADDADPSPCPGPSGGGTASAGHQAATDTDSNRTSGGPR